MDDLHFGVHQDMMYARNVPAVQGAQWTGIVTQIAIDMLESGKVDAVICVQNDEQDRFKPKPVSHADCYTQLMLMPASFSDITLSWPCIHCHRSDTQPLRLKKGLSWPGKPCHPVMPIAVVCSLSTLQEHCVMQYRCAGLAS